MKRILMVCAAASLVLSTVAAAGDGAPAGASPVVVRPLVGAYIPTGTQHSDFKSAVLAGAQLAYDLPAPFEIVGTMAWTPSKDRGLANSRTNILQYDAGLELGRRPAADRSLALRPFLGLGLGGRSYHFDQPAAARRSDLDGYGSLGGELTAGRVGARLELRDYLSRFGGIGAASTVSTRNDLMLAGEVSLRL